jgi:hypothetical protein
VGVDLTLRLGAGVGWGGVPVAGESGTGFKAAHSFCVLSIRRWFGGCQQGR